MAEISSGAGSTKLTVDPTSNAARATLYDAYGNVVVQRDRTAVTPGVTSGMPMVGVDYKTAHAVRTSPTGSLRVTDEALLFYDECEGAAVDTTKWIQSLTTMTITQTAAAGTLFNSGAIGTAAAGAMQLSHRRFPIVPRGGLVARATMISTAHSANNQMEIGFGSPATAAVAASGDGAFWRKNGSGQWIPVISINGSTEILGTAVEDVDFRAAVLATNYAIFEVVVFSDHVHFEIYTHGGTPVSFQDVEFTGPAPGFAVTHLQAMERIYNSGVVVVPVTMRVKEFAVYGIDAQAQRPWRDTMALVQGYGSLASPTAYTQLANYTNLTAPASATLSNTAGGYAATIRDGLFQFALVAGAETDYALFAWQCPAPYAFVVTGIRINSLFVLSLTTGFTAPLAIQWGAAFNSSAVSLATAAPYSPMRVALGTQLVQGTSVATVGTLVGPDIIWTPGSPLPVLPGRFLHIMCRISLLAVPGTACVVRGSATVDGYFE